MKIYTIVANKPDLLALQLESFRRNLTEAFEFIVINNSPLANPESWDAITSECSRLGIKCIDVTYDAGLAKQYESDSGDRVLVKHQYSFMTIGCGYGVQRTWQNIISNETGKVALIHHDMFCLKPINLSEYLGDAALAFIPQIKPGVNVHLWEGFVIANMDILPDAKQINWAHGLINNVRLDVGGMSHYWFQAHPEVKWKGIKTNHIEDTLDVDFHPALFEYLCFDDVSAVLHYRAASDWMEQGKEYHDKKTAWLKRQLQ